MASEIRVNKINSRTGVGTITLSPTGVDFTGIATVATLKATTGIVTTLSATGNATVGGTLSITGDVDIADKIVHTGDTNTAIRFPTADTITAETAGSERLRITSGGAVQITGVDDQDNLLVKGGSTHFAVHQDDTDGEVSLRAQDGSGSNNSKYMTFFTNPSGSAATERLRILSGGGLTFNGDTATANALDDYEEGTFTPTYQTGLTSPSYGDTSGHYTKIGQLVTFTIRINATGTNSSSHLQVGGLPFSSNTHNEGSVSFGYTDNLNGSNGLTGHIGENGSKISMYQFSGSNFNGNTGNGISGRTLHMRGFYYTDS